MPEPPPVVPASLRPSEVSCQHGRLLTVDRVSLDLEPGQHLAITGTNGTGKSTLLRAVPGLHRETTGVIEVEGRRARGKREWARRRSQIAWVPQRQAGGWFPLLVRELPASGGDLAAAVRSGADLGIGQMLERPLATLSGGRLQRDCLARALGQVDHAIATVLGR